MGPVLGVAARSRSPYVEGLKSLTDGHSTDAEHRRDLMAGCRVEAIRHMLNQASGAGANAVVAMRFDHRAVTDVWNEVCAYGTAVWVVPLRRSGQIGPGRPAATADSVL
ncbi:UPF0145 protein [Rhizocola hellebori]|uniref:UPF0145 protein n=1 Tax=Rhizocola hellebori TaxID=1392758 RepID=A0A8J3VJC8_9ACTN|nr:UPF0145 protein [Rhizocola hellebori]